MRETIAETKRRREKRAGLDQRDFLRIDVVEHVGGRDKVPVFGRVGRAEDLVHRCDAENCRTWN